VGTLSIKPGWIIKCLHFDSILFKHIIIKMCPHNDASWVKLDRRIQNIPTANTPWNTK
jgi:hypothetical protein